jgi:hypothetical protein
MVMHMLVHGAWHGGWCWRKVTLLLRAAGHDAMITSPADVVRILLELG